MNEDLKLCRQRYRQMCMDHHKMRGCALKVRKQMIQWIRENGYDVEVTQAYLKLNMALDENKRMLDQLAKKLDLSPMEVEDS